MAIVLKYRIPKNNQRVSVQTSALTGVPLQQGATDNELTLLDITETGRTVVAIAGPPAELELQISYAPGPRFAQQCPTDEAKLSALRGLWTERISLQLGVIVTALEPTL